MLQDPRGEGGAVGPFSLVYCANDFLFHRDNSYDSDGLIERVPSDDERDLARAFFQALHDIARRIFCNTAVLLG
jgi:hypothetical protein